MFSSNSPNTRFGLLLESTDNCFCVPRKFLATRFLPVSYLFERKDPVSCNRWTTASMTATKGYLARFGYNSMYFLAAALYDSRGTRRVPSACRNILRLYNLPSSILLSWLESDRNHFFLFRLKPKPNIRFSLNFGRNRNRKPKLLKKFIKY